MFTFWNFISYFWKLYRPFVSKTIISLHGCTAPCYKGVIRGYAVIFPELCFCVSLQQHYNKKLHWQQRMCVLGWAKVYSLVSTNNCQFKKWTSWNTLYIVFLCKMNVLAAEGQWWVWMMNHHHQHTTNPGKSCN